jgi:acyl carrier protein
MNLIFNILIPDEEARKIKTVINLIEIIENKK